MSSSSSTGFFSSSSSSTAMYLVCDSANAGNHNLPSDCNYRYFVYEPNSGANAFFLAFFILLAILIGYQAIRSRQHWLHSLTLFAALEAAGYVARQVQISSPSKSAFTGELVILILAPNCLAFCCYVILGKIITYVFKTHSDGKTENWLTRHPSWVPGFYLCSDLLCIIIQGIGGAILSDANTSSELNRGKAVELAGLGLQLFFIATFLIICYYVWHKMREQGHGAELVKAVTPSYIALMIIIALLVVRNIYRCAEFGSGGFTTGYFQQNEDWYLCFDPTLMSAALLVAVLFDFTKRLPADCLDASMVGGALDGIGGKHAPTSPVTNGVGGNDEMVQTRTADTQAMDDSI